MSPSASRKQRPLLKLFLMLVVLTLVVAAAGSFWAWQTWQAFHEPFGESRTVRVDIDSGTSARAILEDLELRGVLANALHARLFLVHRLGDPPLQAGEYSFDLPATATDVLAKLVDGEVVTYPITILEGLTLEETARALSDQELGDYDRFVELMRSSDLIDDIDPSAETLEGYLFPDTYRFAKGTSETEIVEALVANFRRRVATSVLGQLGEDRTLREVVILASIVEREATLDSERPTIAGVYAHRLRIGMGLYADPTIIFALKQMGTWDGNLRRADLQLDSPYNTYVYPGLPPGPICSPGLRSLEAAVSPPDVPYLYFVSRNDGTHVFARTLAEHNRNVDKWQRQYWRERWARERAKR